MDIGRLLLGILAIFLLMAAILSTFAGTRMWIMRQMGKGTCRWCGHWLNAWRNSWGLGLHERVPRLREAPGQW
jgi:hypothetical protein